MTLGQDNKEPSEDGLFNRFIIAVAYKHRPSRERPEKNQQIPSLSHLFYITKKLHDKSPQEYHYKDDGKRRKEEKKKKLILMSFLLDLFS